MADKIALLRAAKAMLNLHNDCTHRAACRGCVAHLGGRLCRMKYGTPKK